MVRVIDFGNVNTRRHGRSFGVVDIGDLGPWSAGLLATSDGSDGVFTGGKEGFGDEFPDRAAGLCENISSR